MIPGRIFFTGIYIPALNIFTGALLVAGIKVFKLRDAGQLRFAFFSLSSWMLVALQCALLIANQFSDFPNGFFRDTGLWLALTQNALWISAVLSLYSKEFSRISKTLPLPITFPIMVVWALLTYRMAVLDSEAFVIVVTLSGVVTFAIFACLIWPRHRNNIAAVVFSIHGLSQPIWCFVWLTRPTVTETVILTLFPLWHIAVLLIWIKFISAILPNAESSDKEAASTIESDPRSSGQEVIVLSNNPTMSIVLSVLLTIALRLAVERHWSLLNGFWTVWEVTIVGTLLVLLGGGLLHFFRKYDQTIYGMFEIMVGIATTASQIAKAQQDHYLASKIAVGVSAFLIVRGLSNIDEGRKQKLAKMNSESPVIETVPSIPG
jgi:hypothetical protein